MLSSRSSVIHLNIALTFVSFTSHIGHHFSRLPEIKFIVPHTESYCSSFLPFLIIINIFLVYFILFYFSSWDSKLLESRDCVLFMMFDILKSLMNIA